MTKQEIYSYALRGKNLHIGGYTDEAGNMFTERAQRIAKFVRRKRNVPKTRRGQ